MWLTIVLFVLTLPLSYFAIWSYPRLENWWASRSRRSLQKRIAKLEWELVKLEALPLMSGIEEKLTTGITQIAFLISIGFHFVFSLALISIYMLVKPTETVVITFWFCIIMVMNVALSLISTKGFRKSLRFNSSIARKRVKSSIARLSAKSEKPEAESR